MKKEFTKCARQHLKPSPEWVKNSRGNSDGNPTLIPS